MTELEKAAEQYERQCVRPVPQEHNHFMAGARWLLEQARNLQIYGMGDDRQPQPLGTVNLADLEKLVERYSETLHK